MPDSVRPQVNVPVELGENGATSGAESGRSERLLKITSAIANAVTAEHVFEALVDRVATALDASSAGLWLLDEGGEARLVRARGYPEKAVRYMERVRLDETPVFPVIQSLRRGEPVWISSQAELVARYPHLAAMVTPARCYRIACLPLKAQERVLGALALTIEEEGRATQDEREFLLLVANYASQALERLRLFEAERVSRASADAAANRLALLIRASNALADDSGFDLVVRLRRVAAELSDALGSSVSVALIESDGLVHLTAAHHPIPEAHAELLRLSPGTPLRIGEGISGTIAATGESVLFPSIDPQAAALQAPASYRPFLERYPVYAVIGAALRARGRIIGTITLARCQPGQSFTRDDLTLLEELGERAAATVENARLYQETLNARTRAEQLYRFAQAVAAAEREEVVFEAALGAIETALGATRAAVLTFDADGRLKFRAWRNLSEAYRAAVEGHFPWPRDAVAPEPLTFGDVTSSVELAQFHALLREEGIGAMAFIPLVTASGLIGKFMVYYDAPHAFVVHELETARSIANHLASVITRFAVLSKLEDTVRQNELFAAVLAHDLRNPLGAIMNAAQLALIRQEGEVTAPAQDAKPLGRIMASGQRMAAMIEQLLDFARVRSGGGIEIGPRACDLSELCTQAVGELELARPERAIQRAISGDPSGSWDPDRLLQVLSNLIDNAGQHGDPQAAIAIGIDGSERDQVTVTVQNQGAIPEALLPHIFDAFRGTRHRRERSRGLGLGLHIVREIVRAHGGNVHVSSSEAAGTTFTVLLPRHAAPREAPSP